MHMRTAACPDGAERDQPKSYCSLARRRNVWKVRCEMNRPLERGSSSSSRSAVSLFSALCSSNSSNSESVTNGKGEHSMAVAALSKDGVAELASVNGGMEGPGNVTGLCCTMARALRSGAIRAAIIHVVQRETSRWDRP
jgi:hypothetical protein